MQRLTIYFSAMSQAATFVLGGVSLNNVEVVPMYIRNNIVAKILFRFFKKLGWAKYALFCRYDRETYQRLMGNHENVLFWDSCTFDVYFLIAKVLSYKKKNIFFWNPLHSWMADSKVIAQNMRRLEKADFGLSTFDPADSTMFNIQLLKNVNRKVVDFIEVEQCYDFYFVGMPKGREEKIHSLEVFLNSHGYKTNFIIVNSKADYISQMENVRLSSQATCLVDLTSDKYKQSGLTLRPFDALFLGKKLITDNKNILKADFYNPNNIFLLENDNMKLIVDFMKKEYMKIPTEIVNQYDINEWLIRYYDA